MDWDTISFLLIMVGVIGALIGLGYLVQHILPDGGIFDNTKDAKNNKSDRQLEAEIFNSRPRK